MFLVWIVQSTEPNMVSMIIISDSFCYNHTVTVSIHILVHRWSGPVTQYSPICLVRTAHTTDPNMVVELNINSSRSSTKFTHVLTCYARCQQFLWQDNGLRVGNCWMPSMLSSSLPQACIGFTNKDVINAQTTSNIPCNCTNLVLNSKLILLARGWNIRSLCNFC